LKQIADDDGGFIEKLSKNKKERKAAEDVAAKSRFSHSNPFDALVQSTSTPSSSRPASAATQSSAIEPEIEIDGTDSDNLIPQWNSEFWQTYGNKLRVYGTQEEQCDLTAKRKIVPTASSDSEKPDDQEENKPQNDSETGPPSSVSPRRGSVLATLQESLQSLWPGKK